MKTENTATELVKVTHLDGSEESVPLPRLPVTELYPFVQLLGKGTAPEIVALCYRKPIEWVASLSDEGFACAIAPCIQRNVPRIVRLAPHDPTISMALVPLIHLVASAGPLVRLSQESVGPVPTGAVA